jgi:hypothetical protein
MVRGLLDELMPTYDVVERHRTTVRASPDRVYAALRAADLSGGLVTRTLLAVRVLPAVLIAFARSPRGAVAELRERRRASERGRRLADFERSGFRVVAERAPEELVIGLLGKFWTPRGGLRADVAAQNFRADPPSGHPLAGWSVTLAPRAHRQTQRATPTRVRSGADARTRFRAYWLVVRPGSGLIRRAMLRSIRREAERQPRS